MSDLRAGSVVFLLDVDNTLLDNDRFSDDLRQCLEREVSAAACTRYWALFEQSREELGYADYLGALQRYRLEAPRDLRLAAVSAFMLDYPFADRLYPEVIPLLDRLRTWGPTVILSDGDVVFQPRKIQRSGLARVVDDALIYLHKERELDDVARRHPAERYVLVDDKLSLLTAVKQVWGDRVTTVFPRQGHYARDPAVLATCPPADVAVERIGDLLDYDRSALLARAPTGAASGPGRGR